MGAWKCNKSFGLLGASLLPKCDFGFDTQSCGIWGLLSYELNYVADYYLLVLPSQ